MSISMNNDIYKCEDCNKILSTKYRLTEHKAICKVKHKNDMNGEIEKLKNQINQMREQYEERLLLYMNENESLKKQILQLENENKEDYRITEEWLRQNVQHLTIDHIKAGAIGYGNYLIEYPLKNKVICTDLSRKKFKYLNEKGDWIIDPELLTLSTLVFQTLKDKHKELSNAYIQKLSNDLSNLKDINELSRRMDIATTFSDNERLLSKMLDGDRNQFYSDLIRYIACKL
jgi:hypothetical protein